MRLFRRFEGALQVDELVLRLRQLPRGLIAGGLIVGVVLVKQRRALGDAIAARDMHRRQQALPGRPDLDVIRFRIALLFDDGRLTRAQENHVPLRTTENATTMTSTMRAAMCVFSDPVRRPEPPLLLQARIRPPISSLGL